MGEVVFRQITESDAPGIEAVALEAWRYAHLNENDHDDERYMRKTLSRSELHSAISLMA